MKTNADRDTATLLISVLSNAACDAVETWRFARPFLLGNVVRCETEGAPSNDELRGMRQASNLSRVDLQYDFTATMAMKD